MEFSTPAEAKKALEADIPVLNDRFTEVHACSAHSDASAPAAEEAAAKPAAESSKKQDEVNKKLDLIRQRQLVQLQELKSKRTGIARYLAILKQYALLWERCKDESRIPHEEKLRSVSQKIFADAQDVYRLVKSGVERVAEAAQPAGDGAQATETAQTEPVVDNDERAKSELQKTLDMYFKSVCEMDIIYSFYKVYEIMDNYIVAGEVLDVNKAAIIERIRELEKLN